MPSRGLLGFRLEFLSLTRGTGLLNHLFDEYGPHRGPLPNRKRGAMIAKEGGDVTAYALDQLADRGTFFVKPGDAVYGGQIVGEQVKDNDLVIQPCRKKQLTNMRASTADIAVRLNQPRALDDRAGDRVDQRRRARRGHAGGGPRAQANPGPQQEEDGRERVKPERSGEVNDSWTAAGADPFGICPRDFKRKGGRGAALFTLPFARGYGLRERSFQPLTEVLLPPGAFSVFTEFSVV